MFSRILIANRGEIACRIAGTARRLGIESVGVYSEADRQALHVRTVDQAVAIGPAAATDSYLRIDRIIEAARETGSEAIHPGYGFLSENPSLAKACQENRIVFIGPPADAIDAMGSKIRAKQIMQDSGIPLVPGYHGEDQSKDRLRAAAAEIGCPLLIKASAGGGGKGMRIVRDPGEFDSALESARRESAAAFGDDSVLIEKYLDQPRHIEIQVFRDNLGNAVHLFERDCSIQRRHQKILEEAPAPGLSETTRHAMGEAAVRAAEAVDYRGAGTVEFIMDAEGHYYFMEMNTRLQVEHPVTEAITGQDLVEWQLRVAAGQSLPRTQDELSIAGHAVEARVYAENPMNDFLPSTGVLGLVEFPQGAGDLRVDTGVSTGDEITLHYDPMIAKIIAWGPDRDQALRTLHLGLGGTRIAGVETNIDFLRRVLSEDDVSRGRADTHFVEKHLDELIEQPPTPDEVLAIAAVHEIKSNAGNADSQDPFSLIDGWRPNLECEYGFEYSDHTGLRQCRIVFDRGAVRAVVEDHSFELTGDMQGNGSLNTASENVFHAARVIDESERLEIFFQHRRYVLQRRNSDSTGFDETGSDRVTAPMPGKITAVKVAPGDVVERGAPLLVMEAMKMEHSIVAPHNGTIERVFFEIGDTVSEGAELASYAAEEG